MTYIEAKAPKFLIYIPLLLTIKTFLYKKKVTLLLSLYFYLRYMRKKTAFSFRYDWNHLICQVSSVYLSIYCEQDFDTSEEYIHDNNMYFVANPQIFSSRNKFSSNFLIIKMTHLKKYLRVSSQWNTIRKWDSK